jgi:predicted nucleic acid-binding Zn ribbon protein
MPKYLYKCTSCDVVLGMYHAMADTVNDCTQCGAENSLVKKPSSFSLNRNQEEDKKVGSVVRESIEDFKEDLDSQKKDLQGQMYTENE